ncbi:MAG: hypothetical protein WBQ86_15955 [Candidatus Binatus sp.]
MTLRQVILSRVIRQVAIVSTGAPRLDAIQRIKERYHFMKAPLRFEDLNPDNPLAAVQGLTFQEGEFVANQKRIGILRFQFVPGVILADSRATTEETDLFLEDYINFANGIAPEAITSTGPTYYLSQVEVTFERPQGLREGFSQYEEACRMIDRSLEGYGLKVPKFDFWGVNLNIDAHHLGVLAPAFFNLERRAGFPFSANVFFSQAPLRTKDHLVLLEKLDSIIH